MIINRENTLHRKIYLILMILLAVSLPLSVFATTLAEILLFINWIAEGNYREKIKIIFKRKSILVNLCFYLVYIGGLIFTSNFIPALQTLKAKLPLIILPVIIGTSNELDRKEVRVILFSFISGTFCSSVFSSAIFFKIIPYEYIDIRDISIFISHIRLSLMVVFSIFILLYFIFTSKNENSDKGRKFVYVVLSVLLLIFLFILKSYTGLFIFTITFIIVIWNFIGKIEDIAPRFILRVLIITLPLIAISYITKSVARFYHTEEVDISLSDSLTFAGNLYFHDTISKDRENGYYVWIWLSEKELRKTWNELSKYDYDGKDKRNQDIRYTIIRYLTSKGLRKDEAGLRQLTDMDIKAIENGITNYLFLNRYSLYPRIYEITWEIDRYLRGEVPGDHSIVLRIVAFKAATSVFLKHPYFGTGTGDSQYELNKYFEQSEPVIPESLRKPPHNQYLTLLMTFGFFGFIIQMTAIFLPVYIEKKYRNYFVRIFFLILLLSMFSDDTLDTQTGISFFMFFYSVFIFGCKNSIDLSGSDYDGLTN